MVPKCGLVYIYIETKIDKAKNFLPSHRACNRTSRTSRLVPSQRASHGGRGDKIAKHYSTRTKQDYPSNTEKGNVFYFKLPYVGKYSTLTLLNIKHLCKRFCNEIDIKLVFSTYKIKNFFHSLKDPIPDALKSFVFYQFIWAECNGRYIGGTSRHFSTRIKEYFSSDKNSHVYKHLNDSVDCKSKYASECFNILDSAKTTYSLNLKEALYIKSEKTHLNTQVQYLKTFLNLWHLNRYQLWYLVLVIILS